MAIPGKKTLIAIERPMLITSTLGNLRMTLELLRRANAEHNLRILRDETKQLIRLSSHLQAVLDAEDQG